ncbi:hypothetical protein ACO0K9_00940 [Undibacterium sp. Ji50W]|uniref:hypothetical protein n=1 Tax=Undibacterium sp. Ji50W TaxID=3413041 RepID=UPI003BF198B7
MSFKINSIKDAQTADVELKHPETGAPLDATVTLMGPEHPSRKALEFARQRELRKGLQKTGKVQFGDPVEDEQDAIDELVAITTGWSGICNDDGSAIAFSAQAARDLYTKEDLGWLRTQLFTAKNERERFIKSSAPA